jgi:dTDP-4-dehydrorhamnose reductase
VLRSALIVGVASLIGRALARTLRASDVYVHGTWRHNAGESGDADVLDLSRPLDAWQIPAVDCAFLCAALTSTAACESNPALSHRINVEAQVAIAERLNAVGTRVVFLSTSMVFDGSRPLRLANERTCPTSVYGAHKAEAEWRMRRLGDRVSVLRLTKVLTSEHPLLRDWRSAMHQGREIHPFSDVVLAPVGIEQVLEALVLLANEREGNIFQLSGERDVSYAQLATALGCDPRLIQPISGAERYPSPPPAHTTLDVAGLRGLGMHVLTTDQTLQDLHE